MSDDIDPEALATQSEHLDDQIQRLKSTVAILKSTAGIEHPTDAIPAMFSTATLDADDDWEYLLGLVGEAAREDIDDSYERAAYVVDRWCHELHHEPQNPYGDGPAGFATDGGTPEPPVVEVGDRVTAILRHNNDAEYVEAVVVTVHGPRTIDAVYRVESRTEHDGDGSFERDHHTDRYEFQTSLVYMADIAGWLKGWDDA